MYNLPRYHPQLVNKSLASLSLNAGVRQALLKVHTCNSKVSSRCFWLTCTTRQFSSFQKGIFTIPYLCWLLIWFLLYCILMHVASSFQIDQLSDLLCFPYYMSTVI